MIVDYEKDWLMRQIRDLVRAAALIVFGKEWPEARLLEQEGAGASDDLARRLERLYERREYRQALDALSGGAAGQPEQLLAALEFCDRANRLTEEELAAGGISREDLLDAVQAVLDQYGLPL